MPEPSCPLPTRAYNLELLHQEGGPGEQSHGWCFGQPPGILPEQWPLDPLTGYPLVHGFTLRLPRDYRCHGADIVGLSVFACWSGHSDGGTTPDEEIRSVMAGSSAPADSRYLPFWTSVQNSHPRLSRVTDVLDDNYAVILLNEGELNGPYCQPPDTSAARALSCHKPPEWLETGNGRPFFGSQADLSDAQSHYLFKVLSGVPDARLDWSRGLRWSPRVTDPKCRQGAAGSLHRRQERGISAALLLRGWPDQERELPQARLDCGPCAKSYRRHHAADPAHAEVQSVLCRVRGISGRLQFRHRKLPARPSQHAARLGLRQAHDPEKHALGLDPTGV
jgi:hypothetical protein